MTTPSELKAMAQQMIDDYADKDYMKDEVEVATALLQMLERPDKCPDQFMEYFVTNYPGPNTVISNPKWHAPKIYRAAIHAFLSAAPEVEG